jgi:adenylylsulfate kinase
MSMPKPKSKNIVWSAGTVSRRDRERVHGHRACILWLTGLSGSGKSTIAYRLEERLTKRKAIVYVLDGDNVRHGISSDLGFSHDDRNENVRRTGEVAKLFLDAGQIVVCAFISPLRAQRRLVRELVHEGDFVEVYVRASLEVCEARDPKGLYKRARAGEIPDFTGVGAPYEPPERPEVTLDTEGHDIEESTSQLLEYLERAGYFSLMKRARPLFGGRLACFGNGHFAFRLADHRVPDRLSPANDRFPAMHRRHEGLSGLRDRLGFFRMFDGALDRSDELGGGVGAIEVTAVDRREASHRQIRSDDERACTEALQHLHAHARSREDRRDESRRGAQRAAQVVHEAEHADSVLAVELRRDPGSVDPKFGVRVKEA